MKKKILALVLGALSISTIGAFAQTPNTTPAQQTETQCCKEKKDKKDHKGKKEGRKEKGERMNPFAGIQLTPEQKTQIDNLRAQQRAQRESGKEAMKEKRAQERQAFNDAVAKILTPEQYTQYVSNCELVKMKKVKGSKAPGKVEPRNKAAK